MFPQLLVPLTIPRAKLSHSNSTLKIAALFPWAVAAPLVMPSPPCPIAPIYLSTGDLWI